MRNKSHNPVEKKERTNAPLFIQQRKKKLTDNHSFNQNINYFFVDNSEKSSGIISNPKHFPCKDGVNFNERYT
jgi:hypothetical protein